MLKGSLPRVYALSNLDTDNLGKLIDTISNIGLDSAEQRAKDTLGRFDENSMRRFAFSSRLRVGVNEQTEQVCREWGEAA